MSNPLFLIDLAAKVGQTHSRLDRELISKNMLKIHKLVVTIRKRDAWPFRNEAIDRNTESFIRKAEDLAREIGCEFLAADSPLGDFRLKISDTESEKL